MNKGWIFVILTSLFELFWVFGFNVADTWWHWVIILAVILIDMQFLAKACESLPTGTVYAVFAAAGTVGTALMDILIFDAEFSIAKGLFMGILVIGVIALKLFDNKPASGSAKGVR
ncbi:QacE family quaternary ammonium compound efflux SMR transporter [Paenibacillus oralis]|uniref:QacE family quaternary ammonium compound efflux SMR transporter n=1 Tax=Paenibacillus oralis TaxID=2490856 RepID=A0A3P3U3M0_9BACL|nr:SMR family transporter [Paenibacillus oralis]RRJ64952.1 QacE family quaternary ammonium compound efflux SMR transporter [Paenibacillus oralis]